MSLMVDVRYQCMYALPPVGVMLQAYSLQTQNLIDDHKICVR